MCVIKVIKVRGQGMWGWWVKAGSFLCELLQLCKMTVPGGVSSALHCN